MTRPPPLPAYPEMQIEAKERVRAAALDGRIVNPVAAIALLWPHAPRAQPRGDWTRP